MPSKSKMMPAKDKMRWSFDKMKYAGIVCKCMTSDFIAKEGDYYWMMSCFSAADREKIQQRLFDMVGSISRLNNIISISSEAAYRSVYKDFSKEIEGWFTICISPLSSVAFLGPRSIRRDPIIETAFANFL